MRSIFRALAPYRPALTSPDEIRTVNARLAEYEARTVAVIAESQATRVELTALAARLDALAATDLPALSRRLHTEVDGLAADIRTAGIDAPNAPAAR